jgi:hypothetical protein
MAEEVIKYCRSSCTEWHGRTGYTLPSHDNYCNILVDTPVSLLPNRFQFIFQVPYFAAAFIILSAFVHPSVSFRLLAISFLLFL